MVGEKRGFSELEMIHDTSRLSADHFHQQDSSHSSSFAAYETASVRPDALAYKTVAMLHVHRCLRLLCFIVIFPRIFSLATDLDLHATFSPEYVNSILDLMYINICELSK